MANEITVKEQGFISDVSPDRWAMMLSQAETIVKAKVCPSSDTKETVVVKILAGREYGLSAMQSLRMLYVVSGKVAMMSDTAAGLCFSKVSGAKIDCIETTDKIATFEASRPGGKPMTLSFTMEDAKRAGLGGVGWTKYPAQMLRARCQIAICRLVFPDAVAGLYTPEELGGDKEERPANVPFDEQIAKERERIAKKELTDKGVIEAEITPSDTSTPPDQNNASGVPPAPPEPKSDGDLEFKDMTEAQKQDKIIFMGQSMFPDGIVCADYFIKKSAFVFKEEGKTDKPIKGKDNPYNLHAGRLNNTYHKVKDDYEKFTKKQINKEELAEYAGGEREDG